MRKKEGGFVADFLAKYTDLLQIVLVAVFIALGIDIIAGALLCILQINPWWHICIGLLIVLLPLFGLFLFFLARTRHEIYEGFLIHDMKKNKFVVVPRYRFSEKLDRYFIAAFQENKTLQAIWGREPMRHWSYIDDDVPSSEGSIKLIREAAEYFLFDSISLHLSAYFQNMNFRRDKLKVFERNDIPQILRQNRFLNLITKPPEERSVFNYTKSSSSVYASYRQGALYHRLHLTLPKDSLLTRIGKNKIRIDTKRFTITFSVQFDGMLTTLPDRFELYYLGRGKYNHMRFGEYSVIFEIDIKLKWKMLLPGPEQEYYKWIDSYLDTLDSEVSEDRFFNSIGWSSALTIYDLLRYQINRSKN